MIFPYYYLLLHSQNYRFQIFTMLITGSQQREQRSHTSVSLHTGYAHIKRRIRFRSPSRTRIQRNATNRSRLLEEGICPEGQGVTKPCQLVLKNGSQFCLLPFLTAWDSNLRRWARGGLSGLCVLLLGPLQHWPRGRRSRDPVPTSSCHKPLWPSRPGQSPASGPTDSPIRPCPGRGNQSPHHTPA